ncbi:Succinate dehydogenase/fumarate reductase N-terminal [Trypanosoma melophagium]|uniref:Succinate dehydogenase/fumarate reductase N-terminal n=1 Tax=Trypanosoma melophagium TaxID=715481 RepID=UPI00351A57D7|nr:Succinate dehydogenase/fumarate reductase N-terminal [Trypanosoma melophagium]
MLRKIANPYKVSIRRCAATAPETGSKAILRLIRYDPVTNEKRVESYEYDRHHEYMVLDLITAVKAHQDPTLAFRASCCEGVCGSCAMNINGINSLACITFSQHVTTVGPLPNFPVIKDFVVDLRHFFRQYAYIRPFVRNSNLDRSRVDSIMARYNSVSKAIHGVSPHEEATRTKLAPHAGVQTEVIAMLRLADALREAGDVSHLVHVLTALEERGVALDQEKLRKLMEETLQNHSRRRSSAA